jgi:hypothetical protein
MRLKALKSCVADGASLPNHGFHTAKSAQKKDAFGKRVFFKNEADGI